MGSAFAAVFDEECLGPELQRGVAVAADDVAGFGLGIVVYGRRDGLSGDLQRRCNDASYTL